MNLCLHWHFRFPIPDLRPAVDRRPWWKQSLRKECLIFDFSAVEFNTSLTGSELPRHYNLSFKELHGMKKRRVNNAVKLVVMFQYDNEEVQSC